MKKKALITGASRGIGKAIAERLAFEGYDLVLTCKENIVVLQGIARDLTSQYKIMCDALICDCSNIKHVESLFSQHNDFDVVVNNAGISFIGLLQDMSVDEWDTVIGTNLSSVFYTTKFAVDYMISQQSGRIINISSMWGKVGASMEVAYSASKGGVDAFTKALAKELAPSHITVNAVSCGVIDTDMNKCFDDDERKELEESIPVGRYGRVEEVADVVYKLISAPEYLTGQIVSIDGGFI